VLHSVCNSKSIGNVLKTNYLSTKQVQELDHLKRDIDQFRPFSAHTVSELRRYFRIGLTWSSNALEGNTLTESETKAILEDGLTIGGKAMREHLEAMGHADAFDSMWTLSHHQTLTSSDVCALHRLFYLRMDESNAGVYRNVPVLITGTDYIPPSPADVYKAMQVFDDWLAVESGALHPIERAFETHVKLVNIHPFIDGNGRTARLILNLVLMQNGYPITLIPPILRASYIKSTADANKGNSIGFYKFMAERLIESSREYLRLVKSLSHRE
jgi:Fic family protein